jgi:hypothetical protein
VINHKCWKVITLILPQEKSPYCWYHSLKIRQQFKRPFVNCMRLELQLRINQYLWQNCPWSKIHKQSRGEPRSLHNTRLLCSTVSARRSSGNMSSVCSWTQKWPWLWVSSRGDSQRYHQASLVMCTKHVKWRATATSTCTMYNDKTLNQLQKCFLVP